MRARYAKQVVFAVIVFLPRPRSRFQRLPPCNTSYRHIFPLSLACLSDLHASSYNPLPAVAVTTRYAVWI